MKKLVTLMLTAGMLFGAATGALAVDFKAKGQWIFGFGLGSTNMLKNGNENSYNGDNFMASQRVRLQIDAVASESLSGTVFFEIGDQRWGEAGQGASLGTDGVVVEVRRAYIDWMVPNTELSIRMGLQDITLPNVAGGSAILADDAAGVVASYKFNDMVSLAAAWVRPYNDNYGEFHLDANNPQYGERDNEGYLDNIDLFALMLPITGNGWSITPWAMYGMAGANSPFGVNVDNEHRSPVLSKMGYGLLPAHISQALLSSNSGNSIMQDGWGNSSWNSTDNAYVPLFFAGLPISITALDPWNFELDINYGYVGSFGEYSAGPNGPSQWSPEWTYDTNGALVSGPSVNPLWSAGNNWNNANIINDASTERKGWLVKALVEYKMDWGTPGIFGWYGSGDDGDLENGSERMPVLSPSGTFTSFIGDASPYGMFSGDNYFYELQIHYSGTWGLGLQIKDLSFLEGLKHTLRVAYWGGTNSPEMADYLGVYSAAATPSGGGFMDAGSGGFYLTTQDYLVEINVDSVYQIYDNLSATLELGYIVNGIDQDLWNQTWRGPNDFAKGDGAKAALYINYSF